MNRALEFFWTLPEIGRVLGVLARIERARRKRGPRPLLEELRQQGSRAAQRDEHGRRCLRRAIRWVDACLGPNCYRRVLLEVALDRGAASEPIRFGLKADGARMAGHAWLGGDDPGSYDIT